MTDQVPPPIEAESSLKRSLEGQLSDEAHPTQSAISENSTATKPENNESNGSTVESIDIVEPAAKRAKLEGTEKSDQSEVRTKIHGIALVKSE